MLKERSGLQRSASMLRHWSRSRQRGRGIGAHRQRVDKGWRVMGKRDKGWRVIGKSGRGMLRCSWWIREGVSARAGREPFAIRSSGCNVWLTLLVRPLEAPCTNSKPDPNLAEENRHREAPGGHREGASMT